MRVLIICLVLVMGLLGCTTDRLPSDQGSIPAVGQGTNETGAIPQTGSSEEVVSVRSYKGAP